MSSESQPLEPENALEIEQLRAALEAAQVGTWDYNFNTHQAQWSGICKQLFGLPPEATITADTLLKRVHPADRESVRLANKQALDPQGTGEHNITFRTQTETGGYRWVQAKGRTVTDSMGRIIRFAGIVQDVSETIWARQQLEANEKRLQQIFEQAPVVLSIVGREPDFVYRMANEAFAALVDRPLDQIVGKPLLTALPDIEGQGFDKLLEQVATTGVPYVQRAAPVELVRGGQRQSLYFDYLYYPLREVDGEITGVMGVVIDVTDQVLARQVIERGQERYRALSQELDERVKQRTRALNEANQDLSRSNENLEQFAYIASHDLQEPLRKIQSFSSILQERYGDRLGDDGVDLLERLTRSGDRMSRLIRDLLSFSRIATRQATLNRVSLQEIVRQTLDTLSITIEESKAQIRVGDLPIVEGDETQLGQLFQNLLSNALKFRRPAVRPEVSIAARSVQATELPPPVHPARASDVYCWITISDNGIGFDDKYTDRIFQVFQRLHSKQDYAGTGVGLAICQKVVTNHGGYITASSQPGVGSTFHVYLPA
ncbi:ATP-binding protein [Spirosoma sordidisoli]|uniref:histidine kinase n=1 Tax=Spirosoma sordidisoli TaxID=2502893 RepID=A0A4Q2UIG9_9BACT|nr:ATP-binding protein [Spirosoma sordidisoli]RYC68362.1 PAS domain S-box protein [Spirosoma sordidisoli]